MNDKLWFKHYVPEISTDIDIQDESLNDLFDQATAKFENQIAMTFYGRTFTFGEVDTIVKQYAAALYSSGIEKGDRVAIMLPNCPHYLFTLFATFRIGAIAVQVNPMYVEREIEHVLKDARPKMMVAMDAFYSTIKSVQKDTSLKKIIAVSLTGGGQLELQGEDTLFDDFLPTANGPAPEVDINPKNDTAVLQYTGGTTGLSKGVMLTHANLRNNVEQVYEFMFKTTDVPNNPKALSVLPMFHIFGLTCNAFQGFRAGTNQIILPRFELDEVLEVVKKERPFQMSGVPTMFIGLNSRSDLEDYGFSDIAYYNSGGAAMPVEQLKYFEKRTDKQLCEGYGLSETSPTTHFNPPFAERRIGSIGIPLPGTDVRVVSETNEGLADVATGEVGELAIKGPQVMKGYWEKPEETNAVLKEGGWLLTGDLGRMDDDGYFYIVDRKKDMIVAGGYNVYPREIEEVLYQHSAVSEVVVVGVPDEYRGETVKAFVTLKEGETLTEEELIASSRKYLAAYKVPRQVEFRDELPKSAVGKLLKRSLRDEEVKKYEALNSRS